MEDELSCKQERIGELEDASIYLDNSATGLDFQMRENKIDSEKKIAALEGSLRQKENTIEELSTIHPREHAPRMIFYLDQKETALKNTRQEVTKYRAQILQLRQAAIQQSFWDQNRACLDAVADEAHRVTQEGLERAKHRIAEINDFLKVIGHFHAFNQRNQASDPDKWEEAEEMEKMTVDCQDDMKVDPPEEIRADQPG